MIRRQPVFVRLSPSASSELYLTLSIGFGPGRPTLALQFTADQFGRLIAHMEAQAEAAPATGGDE